MDLAQTLIFYASWIFFGGWGTVLATLSVVAFGRDFLAPTKNSAEISRSS